VAGFRHGRRHHTERTAELLAVGVLCRGFHPGDIEWDKYGKSARPIRNRKMAEIADLVIVFWDLESRGTKSMIKEAIRLNKKLLVFDYSGALIEPEKLKKLL